MEKKKITIRFPFTGSFTLGKKRVCHYAAWADGQVEIDDVTGGETSIAYRLTRHGAETPCWDIRSYQGRQWWPVVVRGRQLSGEELIATAGSLSGYFIAAMHLPPDLLGVQRLVSAEQFFRDPKFRKRHSETSTHDLQYGHAWRHASELLICDDLVYRVGGEPVYFGVPSGEENEPVLSLHIGSLQFGEDHIEDGWQLGPSIRQRQAAARRGDVFNLEDIDDGFLASRRGRYRCALADDIENMVIETVDIETVAAAPREIDVMHYCADAMARAIIDPPGWVSSAQNDAMDQLRKQYEDGRPIPIKDACEIIVMGLEWSIDPERDFGIVEHEAIKILNASITDDDNTAIASIG